MKNPLKEKLEKGKSVLGSFLGIYSPPLVEMIGYAGYDFVVIDDEHGAFSPTELEDMIRTADSVDLVPIVRVSYDQSSIQKALDRGALGIQVPMINTKEEAEEAVQKAKFPPRGRRGAAYSHRAAHYGKEKGKNFLDESNEEILVIPHIETLEAAENFHEIINVEGIDFPFIGTTDLSVNMGYKEEGPNHPEVRRVVERIYMEAKERDIKIGTVANDATGANKAYDKGASYVGIVAITVIANALGSVLQSTNK
ncbi:HpcH/HpaI aldolase family protein [Halobacillus trueperi]|uniref:HpcH/HpaI aldolase/citrate lyase domain-containing protein n=1 Tax=Halobacillus trueperi TaxID=156205 RepID=A0A3E0J832_9BACI|nr:aldolase/citrate lyase family protein [Halobacillus trueperi]REJ09073.1 hypothetical protein DYE48_11920 [Halobacillus trueperi]